MNNLLEKENIIKEEIEKFPLEIDKGTKKMIHTYHVNQINERNKIVNKYLKKYSQMREQIIEELKFRKEKSIPTTNIIKEEIENSNNEFKNIVVYTKTKLTNDKLKITYEINQISHANNDLNVINKSIKSLIEIFKDAGIILTSNDFMYTTFSYDYMTCFLKNMKSDKFDNIIKGKFERVYWLCPDIISHLKLNFYSLSIKYNKILAKYALDHEKELLNNKKMTKNNIISEYQYLIESTDKMYNSDEYLLTIDFFNNVLNPDDYLKSSTIRAKKESKFLIDKTVDQLEDKEKYYLKIENLNRVLKEYDNYLFFKPFFEDVLKRIQMYDKNLLKNKLKEYDKLDKERNKHVSKIFKLLKRDKNINQDLLFKENEIVSKINQSYDELIEIMISDNINKELNTNSNIQDALAIFIYDYNYFLSMYSKVKDDEMKLTSDELYNKLIDFVYSPYIFFINNNSISSVIDVPEMISNKFKLLDINITPETITESLKELILDTNYIVKIYYVELMNLDFKTYSIINKIKKITS